jgi:hypothetical protein
LNYKRLKPRLKQAGEINTVCKGSYGFVLLYVFGKKAEIDLAILG